MKCKFPKIQEYVFSVKIRYKTIVIAFSEIAHFLQQTIQLGMFIYLLNQTLLHLDSWNQIKELKIRCNIWINKKNKRTK